MFTERHVWALCVGMFLSATLVWSAPKQKPVISSSNPENKHLFQTAESKRPMTQNSAKNGQSKSEPKTPSSNQPTPPKPVASAKETRASKSAAGGTDTVTDRMSGPDYFIPDYGYYYDNLPSYIDQYYGLNLGINMGVPQNTLGSRKRGPLNSNRRPLNLFPFIIDDPCPGFRYLAPYRQALNEFPTGCNPRKPNACPEGAECNPVTKSCCIPKSVKHSPKTSIALYNAGVIDDLCPRSGGYWGMVEKYYGLDVPVACGKGKPKCDPGSVCNRKNGVCCYNTRLASSLS